MWDLFHTGNAGSVSFIYIWWTHKQDLSDDLNDPPIEFVYAIGASMLQVWFYLRKGLENYYRMRRFVTNSIGHSGRKEKLFHMASFVKSKLLHFKFFAFRTLQENVFAETVINCKILGRIVIQIYATQYLFHLHFSF